MAADPRGADQPGALWLPSPNFGPRRDGLKPSLIVLHYTAMTCAETARDWLCHTDAQVSAHYVLGPDGTVWQLVYESDRAWHAGAGAWGPVTDVNSRSIGIEISNTGSTPFAAKQMDALDTLVAGIMQRHAIPPERVIGHSDMAPGRKFDPGRRFDWARLAWQKLAIWPRPAHGGRPDAQIFRTQAQAAGFTAPVADALLLDAVRLRFRPWARGPLCQADMAVVAGLLPTV